MPTDHTLLRSVAAICNQLPMDTDALRAEFLKEKSDSMLLTYLASITKNAQLVSEVMEKVQTAYDRRRGRFGSPRDFM